MDRRGLIKGAGLGTIAALGGVLIAQPTAAQSPAPGPATSSPAGRPNIVLRPKNQRAKVSRFSSRSGFGSGRPGSGCSHLIFCGC